MSQRHDTPLAEQPIAPLPFGSHARRYTVIPFPVTVILSASKYASDIRPLLPPGQGPRPPHQPQARSTRLRQRTPPLSRRRQHPARRARSRPLVARRPRPMKPPRAESHMPAQSPSHTVALTCARSLGSMSARRVGSAQATGISSAASWEWGDPAYRTSRR